MITLNDISAKLQYIIDLLTQRLANITIAASQIVAPSGLSDISESLGVVSAGEFRTGNGKLPGDGFSGVRIGYPSFTYGSSEWNVAGVNNDVLQFGLNATTGAAYAGAGAVSLDSNGITIVHGTVYDAPNAIKFVNSSGDIRMAHYVTENAGAWISYLNGGGSGGDSCALELRSGINYIYMSQYTTPASMKLVSPIIQLNGNWDGWLFDEGIWTRTGDHSFTTGGNFTNFFRKGTKVRYKQGAGNNEYGVVASSSYSAPNTTVNLIPNTDYAINSGTSVHSVYLSYIENPEGFPTYFNYSPTTGGITIGNGTLIARYRTSGNSIIGNIHFTLGSTSAITGDVNFSFPVTISNIATLYAKSYDASANSYLMFPDYTTTALYVRANNAAGTYLSATIISSTIPFTWTTSDIIDCGFVCIF